MEVLCFRCSKLKFRGWKSGKCCSSTSKRCRVTSGGGNDPRLWRPKVLVSPPYLPFFSLFPVVCLGELFCSGVFERPISVGHRLYAGGIKIYALPFRTGNLRCTK